MIRSAARTPITPGGTVVPFYILVVSLAIVMSTVKVRESTKALLDEKQPFESMTYDEVIRLAVEHWDPRVALDEEWGEG